MEFGCISEKFSVNHFPVFSGVCFIRKIVFRTIKKNLCAESFCKKRLEGDGRLTNVDLDREDECGICLEPCTKWFCLIAVMQCASNAIAIGNYHPNVISLMLLMLSQK